MKILFYNSWKSDWSTFYKQIEIIDITIADNFISFCLFNFTIELVLLKKVK